MLPMLVLLGTNIPEFHEYYRVAAGVFAVTTRAAEMKQKERLRRITGERGSVGSSQCNVR